MILLILVLLIPQVVQASSLDSLLADNRIRAGVRAEELFGPIDHPDTSVLCENKIEDYRFLLANLPLSDLALMTSSDLIENINLARKAKQSFQWGCTYPQDFFRSFVLPHRVSQEPFVRYRKQFLEEIGPRVKDLSMGDAILEVNHWCHEKATYRPTDGRDQDPLTTIRSGFGRCEEEMILTICALRSVGIPARQCYTPYWAHSDDNHAWVEAWADGKWYYLGACEPAQELNQAWFSGPAQRAMLVVSTAYGDYSSPALSGGMTEIGIGKEKTGGDASATVEPVLRRYGRSTLINSTAVYGPTKELTVTILDKKGKPVPDCRVIFSLWNYGTLMPAMGVTTDSTGTAKLVCGIGDWFVSAQTPPKKVEKIDPIEDDALFWITGLPKAVRSKIAGWFTNEPKPYMGFAHVKGSEKEVTLKLDALTPAKWLTELEYTPPVAPMAKAPEVISAEGEVRGVTIPPPAPPASERGKALADSLFRARLVWEDSVREADVWNQWRTIEELSYWSKRITDTTNWGGLPEFADYFRKARGNWLYLYPSLMPMKPGGPAELIFDTTTVYPVGFMTLLNTFSEKDFRDFKLQWWGFVGPWLKNLQSRQVECDSLTFWKYVLSPRIDNEPTQAWQSELSYFLRGETSLDSDRSVLSWIRKNITLESSPDRLGPPLTPAQCLELRRGTQGDVERLYIGLCRVRGIPARRNPVTDVVERWEEPGGWVVVNVVKKKEERGKRKEEMGNLTVTLPTAGLDNGQPTTDKIIYLKDWTVARWEGNMADAMDFGWHEPFEKIAWPQELPEGWYLISSGRRREDGSAAVTLKWAEVKGIKNYELGIRNGM